MNKELIKTALELQGLIKEGHSLIENVKAEIDRSKAIDTEYKTKITTLNESLEDSDITTLLSALNTLKSIDTSAWETAIANIKENYGG